MGRPRCQYYITSCPRIRAFMPHGQGLCFGDPVKLLPEEVEALRLKNIVGLDQTRAAKRMRVSQSSFQRVLASAYQKVSHAIIEGREVTIGG